MSTRKVDDLVKALGIDSAVSKSTVPRICAELDAQVGEFRGRRLSPDHPTVRLITALPAKAALGADPDASVRNRDEWNRG